MTTDTRMENPVYIQKLDEAIMAGKITTKSLTTQTLADAIGAPVDALRAACIRNFGSMDSFYAYLGFGKDE